MQIKDDERLPITLLIASELGWHDRAIGAQKSAASLPLA